MAEGPDWKWHGRRYLGAVHGDISIMTQLVVTTPALAQQVERKLDQLLAMQDATGNWPSVTVYLATHCECSKRTTTFDSVRPFDAA